MGRENVTPTLDAGDGESGYILASGSDSENHSSGVELFAAKGRSSRVRRTWGTSRPIELGAGRQYITSRGEGRAKAYWSERSSRQCRCLRRRRLRDHWGVIKLYVWTEEEGMQRTVRDGSRCD